MNLENVKAQANKILKSAQPILKRHVFILVIIALGFAIYVVYSVSQQLQQPSDATYADEKKLEASVNTSFNAKAIEKVRTLRPSDTTVDPTYNTTQLRSNPFAE